MEKIYIAQDEKEGALKIATSYIDSDNKTQFNGWDTIQQEFSFFTNNKGEQYFENYRSKIVHLFIPQWTYNNNNVNIQIDALNYFFYNDCSSSSDIICEVIPLSIDLDENKLLTAYEITYIYMIGEEYINRFKVIYKDYINNISIQVPKVQQKILNGYYIK